ncbi:MAG: orotate phosphoribosyltransferase [Salinivirgaceae bacterium]|jgi:orotate phosphoribosyltransferase|nr:orotate phosphoribosyltransferase [Salinivirgaceae bacterium]
MINTNEIAKNVANDLLQIKAIKLSPSNPFTWASGLKSPIYCDNRKTLSFPKVRKNIGAAFAQLVQEKYANVDVIAGVATGAIALGVLVAEALNKPFVYVRSGAKKHGLENLVEGHLEKGQTVVVIEDLISTGGSSIKAVEALREAGAEVLGLVAIFTYGFEAAENNFKEAKCEWDTLSNYETMLEIALSTGYIADEDVVQLKIWRQDPQNWLKE